jgi:hypothetical protein
MEYFILSTIESVKEGVDEQQFQDISPPLESNQGVSPLLSNQDVEILECVDQESAGKIGLFG